MRSNPGFPVTEIAGRLLHEQYHEAATAFVESLNWEMDTIPSPVFPEHAETDTGTLRAVVIAS